MSRLWLKNGRAVLTDGRAVLCDECPCGACVKTYYVDHARATSGDGHSWETAFNTVNAVFASEEIYNFRLNECDIFVKIRGAINYILDSTTYIQWHYVNSCIWLQPEGDSRGECVIDRDTFFTRPPPSDIIFDRWHFSVSIPGYIIAGGSHNKFLDCVFDIEIVDYPLSSAGEFFSGRLLEISRCSINIFINSGSRFMRLTADLEGTADLVMKDTSISIRDTRSGYSDANWRVFPENRNAVFENVNVNYSASMTNARRVKFECFCVGRDYPSVFRSCSATFSLNIDRGTWADGLHHVHCCAFAGTTESLGSSVFYDCQQNCYCDGDDPDDDYCSDDCVAIP